MKNNCITRQLSNGISISYARYGVPGGKPVFYFHGLPGSRFQAELLHQVCLKHRIDLIAPDRFGFGDSSPVKQNRYNCWVECIAELTDILGFDKFYLIAASGGGPYALDCASRLHESVIATAICCGLGPLAITELRKPMHGIAKLAAYLAQHYPNILRFSYGFAANIAARYFSRLTLKILGYYNGEPDKSVLDDPDTNRIIVADLQCAFRHGATGGIDDLIASTQLWPFDLARIKHLQLWHGDKDTVVPIGHSEWVVSQAPKAKLCIIKNEGHISLPFRQAELVITSLIAKES